MSLIKALKQDGSIQICFYIIWYQEKLEIRHETTWLIIVFYLRLSIYVKGWDGSESEDTVTWSFSGGLFYSITVITTIGITFLCFS